MPSNGVEHSSRRAILAAHFGSGLLNHLAREGACIYNPFRLQNVDGRACETDYIKKCVEADAPSTSDG